MASSLREAQAGSKVSRSQVAAARLAAKKASMACEVARAKIRVGDLWPEAIQKFEVQFRSASEALQQIEESYDRPRKDFLKANKASHEGAMRELTAAVERCATLQRQIALD